jgi:hypothetical protein
MTLKEKVAQGLSEAIATRGKNKGMLKSKCPKMDSYGSAVWQGIMFYSNPHKMGIGHMIFMSKECKEVYQYIKDAGEIIDLSTFDRDGNVLRDLRLL